MRLALLSLLLLCGLTASAAPQDAVKVRKSDQPGLHVDGGDAVLLVTRFPFTLHCGDAADVYDWRLPPTWVYEENEAGDQLTVTSAPEGRAKIRLRTITLNQDAKTPAEKKVKKVYTLELVVGKVVPPAPPVPPGPVPPGPTPPVPPVPPVPDVGPIKVLMLYESASTLPAAQQSILNGKQVRDYLRAKCARDTSPGADDGKAYRIWDKDVDTKFTSEFWKSATARARTQTTKVPTISIYREGNVPVHEGPLPGTVTEAMTLLRKYGG